MSVALAASLGAVVYVDVSPGHASPERLGGAELTGRGNATTDDRYQIVPASDVLDAEIDTLFRQLDEAPTEAAAALIQQRLQALISEETEQIKSALARAHVFDPDEADELLRRADELLAT